MALRHPEGIVGPAVDGYDYIGRGCDRRGTDAFETRLLGMAVGCVRGADAGRVFDHAHGHRCPGEWITIAVMNVAVETLARTILYTVPP